MSETEIRAILDALGKTQSPKRNKALFHLGLRSGFRISELLSLTVGDVYQNGAIRGYVSVAKRHMKKQVAGRTVVIHREAQEALKEWVLELSGDPGTLLFQSREGDNRAITRITAWGVLNKAYKACGLDGKLGTHSMRKTFAERIHETLGRDVFKTQKALGHASLTSTASYLSCTQNEIDEAMKK